MLDRKEIQKYMMNLDQFLNKIKKIPLEINPDIQKIEKEILHYFEENNYTIKLEKQYISFIIMESYKKNIQNEYLQIEKYILKIKKELEKNIRKVPTTQISILTNTIKENINKSFENNNIDDIINNEINAILIRHSHDLMFSKNIVTIRNDVYTIIQKHCNQIRNHMIKIVENDVNELLKLEEQKPSVKPFTIFRYGFLTASIIVGAFISFNLYSSFQDAQETHHALQKISTKVSLGKLDLNVASSESTKTEMQKLKEINSDAVAWIKVNGTKIDHSVVKATDNKFYLDHNFYKEYNENGWAFMDYRNSGNFDDKNTVIYAHNTDVMFASLRNVLNKDWYQNKENRFIKVITEKETLTFEVFSSYTTKVEDYYIRTQFTDNEFKQFVKTIKMRSIFNYEVEVNEKDSILTLSTCNRGLKNGRTVLHAKKVS